MTIALPTSIAAMQANTELTQGVFKLVDNLNGKKMFAKDWKEARQYSEALTMAAVARGDYVVLMHDLWDHFFGGDPIDELGTIDADPSEHSPSEVWGNREIGKTLTLHSPISGIKDFGLYFNYDLETRKFQLSLGSFDTNDNQVAVPEALAELKGWYLKHEGDWEERFLYSPKIDVSIFPVGTDKAVAKAKQLLAAIQTLGK